jgi:hypothetical protein
MLNPSEITLAFFTSSSRRHLICVEVDRPADTLRKQVCDAFPDAHEFDFVAGEEDEEEGSPMLLSWSHRNGTALFPQGQALRLAS